MLTKKPVSDQAAEEVKTPAPRTPKKAQASLFEENDQKKSTAGRKPSSVSRVIVKYDVGFPNHLTIRGKGANLSWSKGIPLKNNAADEWIWETDLPFDLIEFKILVNDNHYEHGDNHTLRQGHTAHYTPHF